MGDFVTAVRKGTNTDIEEPKERISKNIGVRHRDKEGRRDRDAREQRGKE